MLRTISISVLFLAIGTVTVAQQRPAAAMPAGRAEALQAIDDESAQLAELEKIHAREMAIYSELSKLYDALSKKAAEVGKLGEGASVGKSAMGAAGGSSGQDQLLQATKQMQETQMSFNLQYLQLQSQMQNENRSYTAVSNVLKTKHDTVKNSINNIR
jgi:hypothetical protein